jgi:hypothetical protein
MQLNIKTKSEIQELLKKSVATVEFKKKDGSLRTMRCTLQESFLPLVISGDSSREKSENSLSVWSIDDAGWRSFIIENVKRIEV